MKKLFSIILVAVLLVTAMPLGAFEFKASAETIGGTTGDCTWTLDGTALTISGSGAMADYDYIEQPWGEQVTDVIVKDDVTYIGAFAFDCLNLKSAIIGKSVSTIGEYAFAHSTGIEEVIIPDSVTEIRSGAFCASRIKKICLGSGVQIIDSFAFAANDIKEIKLPESLYCIMEAAFDQCSLLTEITIPKNVTYIDEYAFSNCSSLEKVIIPTGISYIGEGAFSYCSKLADVYYCGSTTDRNQIYIDEIENDMLLNATWHYNVQYGTTGDCTWMLDDATLIISGNGAMADNYSYDDLPWGKDITKVVVEDGVTDISAVAFYGCSSLISITIPDSVKSIGGEAFAGCSSLTSVNIPKGVSNIAPMAFASCSSLTDITIPESVTDIGWCSFSGCSSLKSIIIPDSVTSIEDATFSNCISLTNIYIPDSVTCIGLDAFYNTGYYKNDSNWVNNVLYIGKHLIAAKASISGNYSVKQGTVTIAETAFMGCSNLTNVIIPDSVTSIGDAAFLNCNSLTNIIIPNSVTTIKQQLFDGCSSLTSITIPNSVTNIGHSAFEGCSNLTDVYYAGSEADRKSVSIDSTANDHLNSATWHYNSCIDSAKHTYGNVCDSYCNICGKSRDALEHTYDNLFDADCNICGEVRLVSYTVSNGEVTINDFDENFSGDLVIPETVNGYPVTKIDNYAFYKCSGIESITLPNSIKNIGNYAFSYCSSLKEINIPQSVKSIGASAFTQTNNLENITVDAENPNFTAVDGVLFNKSKIELIAYPTAKADTVYTVPEGVTEIKANTFYYCENLTEVNLPSSITKIGDNAFYYCRRLKNVVIPEKVTKIGKLAFFYCSALKSVTLPASVISIGNSAFRNCPFLTDVYYSGTKAEAESIAIESNNANLTSAKWNFCTESHIYSNNCDDTCNVCEETRVAPHSYDNACDSECNDCRITRETEHIFDAENDLDCNVCGSVRYISYSLSNKNITITKLDAGFEGDLVIPSTIKGNPVTKIANYAFYNCSNVESITIPEGVTSIGSYAFSYCSSLKEVNIPGSVKTIEKTAFSQTKALISINVAEENEYFASVDGVLFNEAKTELIKYPTANTNTSYTVPEGVKVIMDDAFYYCENLIEVNLPSSLTKIGNNAFYYCRRLKNVVIPENVTEIGKLAFFYCSALKTVTLPAGIKSIGDSAFRSSPFLANVYYCGTKNQAMNISIGANNNQLTFANWIYNYSK